jgi:hypothetical protein
MEMRENDEYTQKTIGRGREREGEGETEKWFDEKYSSEKIHVNRHDYSTILICEIHMRN